MNGDEQAKTVGALPAEGGVGHLVMAVAAGVASFGRLAAFLGGLPPALSLAVVLQPTGTAAPSDLAAVAAQTPWPVVPAENGTPVLPRQVHVVPPGVAVALRGGRFRIRPARTAAERRGQADRLFRVLAEECGSSGIAVLFDGADGDGLLGLEVVGAAGGMTMLEQMGGAADPTGGRVTTVDHLLPADDMAAVVAEYVSHVLSAGERAGAGALQHEIELRLLEICATLQRRTKHDFRDYKTTTLVRRLLRRMQVLRTASVDAYVARLAEDPQEPQTLFRELLIGVTAFFRDAEAFASLSANVLAPLLADRGPDEQVRIWVPGCATGEEAYSIAILVREELEKMKAPPAVQIFATDIDERALSVARRGSYPAGIAQQMTPERLRSAFVKRGRRYQVVPAVRELCLFSQHSLISDPPFPRIDLISCRNLLIYFGPHLQKKIIPIFHFALRPGGFLFLGASETLTGHGELFRAVDGKNRLSQRKDTRIRVPGQVRDFGGIGVPGWREHVTTAEPDLGAVAQRILLDEFAPEYAVVGEEGQVVYLSERVDRFVQPPAGIFSSSIMRMARRGLGAGLRTALHDAVRHRRTVVRDLTSVHTAVGIQAVRLTVQPMPDLGHENGLYMVVFQERGPVVTRPREEPGHPDVDTIIEQLERELQRTREDLERTVQDLEAANEELKSSNEELLSMNEELQSANEELESSKEEVQAANRALAAANADLENLLRSTRIATIFLDREGNVRSFTPAATEIYNLLPGDVGRPLAHFTHCLRSLPAGPPGGGGGAYADDGEDEAETTDGRWFLRRVLPYRGVDGVGDGVVVTFIEITQLKRTEQALRDSEARLRIALSAGRMGVWDWDMVTSEVHWDAEQYEICGIDPGMPVHTVETFYDLVHPEDRPGLRAAVERTLSDGSDYQQEFRVVRPDGQVRWIASRGSRMADPHGGTARIVGVNFDITARKRAEERQRLLMAELDHRVKNMLAVVQSLIAQTRAGSAPAEEFALALERRIQAMSRTHVLLTQSRWAGANLHDILAEEILPFRDPQREVVRVVGEPLMVKPKAATALSLAFHELVTNAAKYGALSQPGGRVEVSWERTGAALTLRWVERGGPPVEMPRRRGFGTVVVERNLAYELNAAAVLDFAPEGVSCTVVMPMDQLVEVNGVAPVVLPVLAKLQEVPPPEALQRPLRILVVEDNALVAMGVEMAVEQLGWRVVGPAGHLSAALSLAASEALDAAVLDVNLDGAMVFPVAEVLRGRGVPFLFATGYDTPSVLPDMFRDVATVSKPFSTDDLMRALGALVASTARPAGVDA